MRIVPQVAAAMQAVFGKSLDELAKSTGCVQRERKFSGSSLLEMLVFTLLQHPAAKDRDQTLRECRPHMMGFGCTRKQSQAMINVVFHLSRLGAPL